MVGHGPSGKGDPHEKVKNTERTRGKTEEIILRESKEGRDTKLLKQIKAQGQVCWGLFFLVVFGVGGGCFFLVGFLVEGPQKRAREKPH